MKCFDFITSYLTQLTQKEVSFVRTNSVSFQKLKILLTLSPILVFHIESTDFIIYYDVSHYGLGFMLMHEKNVIG